MRIVTEFFGTAVRLTDERLTHVLEHPEMLGMEPEIERTLIHPALVRQSRTDADAKLFCEFYSQTAVGGKWLCVVVKYLSDDAFMVTAYPTDQPKAGTDLWPTK